MPLSGQGSKMAVQVGGSPPPRPTGVLYLFSPFASFSLTENCLIFIFFYLRGRFQPNSDVFKLVTVPPCFTAVDVAVDAEMLLAEKSGGILYRGRKIYGVAVGLLCESLKTTDVKVKQYYRVKFYSDFIWMKMDEKKENSELFDILTYC